MKRLPLIGTLVGSLFGLVAVWQYAASGGHDTYADFVGIEVIFADLVLFPFIGMIFGATTGRAVGQIILELREQDRQH